MKTKAKVQKKYLKAGEILLRRLKFADFTFCVISGLPKN